MGDRFYMQQNKILGRPEATKAAPKPKRRLKADIINEIESFVGEIPSIEKMTVVGLEKLEKALKDTLATGN